MVNNRKNITIDKLVDMPYFHKNSELYNVVYTYL